MYKATTYKGKPAILDTKTRVYYYGYKSKKEAEKKAQELNKEN